jgi:hypothetical protein
MRRQRKQLSKVERLRRAPAWIATYPGKDIVRGYRKHFGVDYSTAFRELEQLGVAIDPERKQRTLVGLAQQQEARRRKRAECEALPNTFIEQDETFAFIVGYTSGGAPYGLTWEEWQALEEANEAEGELGE